MLRGLRSHSPVSRLRRSGRLLLLAPCAVALTCSEAEDRLFAAPLTSPITCDCADLPVP